MTEPPAPAPARVPDHAPPRPAAAPSDPALRGAAELADGVATTLRIARALVESDRRIDLGGIEDAVGRLCARALDLPPEAGAPMRALLIGLRDDMDRLGAALEVRAAPPARIFHGRRP